MIADWFFSYFPWNAHINFFKVWNNVYKKLKVYQDSLTFLNLYAANYITLKYTKKKSEK